MSEEVRELSRDAQIRRLEPGGSVAVADRLDVSFGLADDAIPLSMKRLRSALDQSAHRARTATGSNYQVESGHFVTQSGAIINVAVLTRMD